MDEHAVVDATRALDASELRGGVMRRASRALLPSFLLARARGHEPSAGRRPQPRQPGSPPGHGGCATPSRPPPGRGSGGVRAREVCANDPPPR
jgi:hypothetical protein